MIIKTNVMTFISTIHYPQDQMERKTTRRWQLQDLLHHVGEPGISQSNYGDPHGDVLQARVEPIEPTLKGATVFLDYQNRIGLPDCLSPIAVQALYRAIGAGIRGYRGAEPTLTWERPVYCGTQLKTTVEDKQLHHDDDRRYVTMTLRAKPKYSGRPAYDDVKVWIEEDGGRRLYFARFVVMYINISVMIILMNVIINVAMNITMIITVSFKVPSFFCGSQWTTLRSIKMVRDSANTPSPICFGNALPTTCR
jgi:hypothetical protein